MTLEMENSAKSASEVPSCSCPVGIEGANNTAAVATAGKLGKAINTKHILFGVSIQWSVTSVSGKDCQQYKELRVQRGADKLA